MVLDNLTQSLRDALKKIANAPNVDTKLIKEVNREIQRALLQADVNVKLVLNLTNEIERRALTEKPTLPMREHVIRIVYEELVKIVGNSKEIPLKKQIIMMVGLYGQGKTTTCGKLSAYFKRKGLNVGLIAGDVHRPAAYEQLKQLGEQINISVYGEVGEKNAIKIVKNGLKELKENDVIIIDTSGRHSLEKNLIEEMENIAKISNANERFLVIDATIGQQAGIQAKAFHDAVHITGVIITKLDGSAKGGGALSAVAETKAPIVFIGVGEKINDLEKFEPSRFISRLLGMGDIQSLLEKAKEVVSEESAEKTARKIMSGKFTLKDMYEQMEMLSGMGPLQKIMDMLPLGKFGAKMNNENLEETQKKLKKFKIIMDSMTEEELENPNIIKSSRVLRIAKGSGTSVEDVRSLLKYYETSKKAMKGFSSNRKMRKKLMEMLKFQQEPLGA